MVRKWEQIKTIKKLDHVYFRNNMLLHTESIKDELVKVLYSAL